MKSTFSEEYYRNNWQRFIRESNDSDYINLEEELNYRMKVYMELPKEVFKAVEKVEAKKIADRCTKTLKATMEKVKGIEAGTITLGYTSRTQEAQETNRYIQRFEFNCIQLADFKKKYI